MSDTGPVYNVPLVPESLPIGDGTMRQQMASRLDLEQVANRNMRVAAAYEVLLSHYTITDLTCNHQEQEIATLHNGIYLLSALLGDYHCTLELQESKWVIFNHVGECNDHRHAPTLLGLIEILGLELSGNSGEVTP
jgi:hypothetical protein